MLGHQEEACSFLLGLIPRHVVIDLVLPAHCLGSSSGPQNSLYSASLESRRVCALSPAVLSQGGMGYRQRLRRWAPQYHHRVR